MAYVSNIDLDESYKHGIQKFFIWGHLVPHLTKSHLEFLKHVTSVY
jgi:hypothetical protein